MKTWYAIKAQSDGEAVIDIFDSIGYWGINAQDFIRDLKQLGDQISQIRVRINSDGGEVFDGIAIYNALKNHRANVTVEVYGLAASIASIIAMAGDKVIMPANTFLFIHDPLAVVIGDAAEMRDMADSLDKIAGALQSTYMIKTGKSAEEVQTWMNGDTWFTAAEALDAGLADEVIDAVKLAAKADSAFFAKAPQAIRNAFQSSTDVSVSPPAANSAASAGPTIELVDVDADTLRAEGAAIVKLCASNGLPEMAAEFIAAGKRLADVQKRFRHAVDIRNQCVAAGMPERAAKYIQADLDPEDVSKSLLAIKAALDTADIDNKQRTDKATGGLPSFDPAAIRNRYRDRERNFGRI